METQKVNIGQIMRNVLKQKGITVYQFAKDLQIGQSAVNRWFTLDNLNTETLIKAGEYLEYNFFQHYVKPAIVEQVVKEAEEEYHTNKGITPHVQKLLDNCQEEIKHQKMELLEIKHKYTELIEKYTKILEQKF
jgi:transcriptional regulator with XRE-family HTH domain